MKKTVQRLFAGLCVLCVCFSFSITPVSAGDTPWASSYAYVLNDTIYDEGAVSTENTGDFIPVDCDMGVYPNGVIYADTMTFDNLYEQYMVIFRTDSERGGVFADVYRYDEGTNSAKLLTVLSKGYNIESGIIREVSLGHNKDRRYIVFSDYKDGEMINSEYYTVIDGVMYLSMSTPQNTELSGVASFSRNYLHPEVDVAAYNEHLSAFFSSLKAYAAENIDYPDILDEISRDEIDDLKIVLNKTAGFSVFDIGDYDTMAEYALAVKAHDGEAQLNAITHVYDLGEELYYVRYSTDQCYYNGAVLRRTDAVLDNYQILLVKNDFIPFTQREADNACYTYLNNKLLLEKADDAIESKDETEPKIKIKKMVDVPKLISNDMRLPVALIGGGIILALFVVLVIIMRKDDK